MSEEIRQAGIHIRRTNMHMLRGGRIVIALAFAMSLLIASLVLNVQVARAQNCSNHCYGVVIWPNGIDGAITGMGVVTLTCPPSQCKPPNGNCNTCFIPHVGNVLWVIDRTSSQTNYCFGPNSSNPCWVEAGYTTFTNNAGTSTTENYYWADNRPNGSFHVHIQAQPIYSQDYGYNADVYIDLVNGTNNQWYVSVLGQVNDGITGTSMSNPMKPSEIDMGEEVLGNMSWSANLALYAYNQWASTRNNTFNYQTNGGCVTSHNCPSGDPANPPYDGWDEVPASGNQGGIFYTSS